MIFIPQTKQAIAVDRKPQHITTAGSQPGLTGGYVSNAIELIETLAGALLEGIRIRRQRNRSRRHVAQLNDYLLRDIGLTRDNVRFGTTESFWRS
jgi:uncharacterized protein YjiS (DUF1127 family)